MPKENREPFKRALTEAVFEKIIEIEDELKGKKMPPLSKRHKIRMNRLFRERVGGSFLPFLEVDSLYEVVRSRLVIKLKINELFDCRKERKRRDKN